MTTPDGIRWFKENFQAKVDAAVAGTPFDVDFIAAIACQETGHIWQTLRKKKLPVAEVLGLCVGDTLDADSKSARRAFPKRKSDLVKVPGGDRMFDIARQALIDMSKHIPGFKGAAGNPNKFCHGFGMFQLDLQFFKQEPDYFLNKEYADFDKAIGRCVRELKEALVKIGFDKKKKLTDFEMACVGIVYNTGGFNPKKGLKQGHFDGTRFYGEGIADFLRLARTVAAPGGAPAVPAPAPGKAALPPPAEVTATGDVFQVDTKVSTLRLRSDPSVPAKSTANIIGELPDGQLVRAVAGKAVNGFREVETSLSGGLLRGFASTKFLKRVSGAPVLDVAQPAAEPPKTGIVEVFMPRKAGTVTKRTEIAGAHSLNEPKQPARKGTTPDELRAEIKAIIEYLDVENPAHKRYKPRSGLTFCNIYTHDFCFLAGAYLPRVWWSQAAIRDLATGKKVEPLIGKTIDERRANDLFRWLRDFGLDFGWRRADTLSQLQDEANLGALGLIVARRKEDGKSGHIVMVVPETDDQKAKRDASGQVIAPVQSQAGARNFARGTGTKDWWKGDQFAESAFWLHG
jgi:hypothetical protein